jgi:hypothetical protein
LKFIDTSRYALTVTTAQGAIATTRAATPQEELRQSTAPMRADDDEIGLFGSGGTDDLANRGRRCAVRVRLDTRSSRIIGKLVELPCAPLLRPLPELIQCNGVDVLLWHCRHHRHYHVHNRQLRAGGLGDRECGGECPAGGGGKVALAMDVHGSPFLSSKGGDESLTC